VEAIKAYGHLARRLIEAAQEFERTRLIYLSVFATATELGLSSREEREEEVKGHPVRMTRYFFLDGEKEPFARLECFLEGDLLHEAPEDVALYPMGVLEGVVDPVRPEREAVGLDGFLCRLAEWTVESTDDPYDPLYKVVQGGRPVTSRTGGAKPPRGRAKGGDMTGVKKWRYLEQEEALVSEELGMKVSLKPNPAYRREWGLLIEEEGKKPCFFPIGTEEEARAFFLRAVQEQKGKEVEA